jgi:outer membrane protein assembly factor BamB
VYASTTTGCAGKETGVWAIDLSNTEPNATPALASFPLNGSAVAGLEGLSLGTDGTVYVQTGEGALQALTAKDLKPKASFTVTGGSSVTPVVFDYKGKDLVVTAGKDGSLYLLDSAALGTPLYQTAAIPSGTVWGGLSTWEDTDGTRWVLAPVWGTGNAQKGSIAAFKLEEQSGKVQLTPTWTSREMNSPEPPVITAGTVFALAAGSGSTHAILYALDGTSGKEVYSTASQVAAPANLTGLSIANGRVYFTTTDNTLYAFGIPLER